MIPTLEEIISAISSTDFETLEKLSGVNPKPSLNEMDLIYLFYLIFFNNIWKKIYLSKLAIKIILK